MDAQKFRLAVEIVTVFACVCIPHRSTRMQMETEMMTQRATCEFFGGDRPIHYSTLYRGIAAGRYPRPIAVGPNTKRWRRSECVAALEALIAARDANVDEAAPEREFGRP
jgi:predicted DNA-binding transcriptional regulator AlpA